MIKRLKIKNFKSFKDIDVELGNFNVVIGANASGKSNFVSAIKFLRDIARSGLENAIEEQMGAQNLLNFNLGSLEKLFFEIVTKHKAFVSASDIGNLTLGVSQQQYDFELNLGSDGKFKIIVDKADVLFNVLKSKNDLEKQPISGELKINHIGRELTADFILKDEDIKKRLKERSLLGAVRLMPNILIVSLPSFNIIPWVTDFYRDYYIADFDYKLIRKSTPFSQKKELEEDGSNIAKVLSDLLNNEEEKRKMINLLKYTLGFVEDVNIEEYLAGALIFKLKETYTKEPVPQFLLSEGTINILALIIVLYFQKNPLVILEDFTSAIHPHLISRIVNISKEVSKKKQIIVTTHNPEVLRYIDVNEILLVSRDQEGFSTISKPADKEEVKIFLQNNIGIEDLFVKDLLKN